MKPDTSSNKKALELTEQNDFTVVLLTALRDEYDQILNVSDGANGEGWRQGEGLDGRLQAQRTFTMFSGGTLNIIATWATDMGGIVSSSLATTLVEKYNPDCIAMCGICAGRRGKVSLGDVIFADRLWHYDAGKTVVEQDSEGRSVEVFSADPIQYNLHDRWKQRVENLQRDHFDFEGMRPFPIQPQADWLLTTLLSKSQPDAHPERKAKCPDWVRAIEFVRKYKLVTQQGLDLTQKGTKYAKELLLLHIDGLPAPPAFAIHLAPIGSGSQVKEDPAIFTRLSKQMRKVLGLEMEAFSIGLVGNLKIVPAIVAKAVADFGDLDKDDRFRTFASRSSAECLIRFLRINLEPLLGPAKKNDDNWPRHISRNLLPRDVASFTGRTKQFDHLVNRITEKANTSGNSVITIESLHGMPGIGKTALAVHIAHRIAKICPDAQMFIDLHGFTPGRSPLSSAAALEHLLRALEIAPSRIPKSLDERASFWRSVIADRSVLIVLDNALDSEQVRPLLPASPTSCVIITSRRRLSGLEGVESLSLDVLTRKEGIALMRRIVGFQIFGTNDKDIGNVVRLCGFLPLAIQLVGNRWRHHLAWTVSDLIKQLQDSRKRLKSIRSESVDVASAFDVSYRGLPNNEQRRLFRLLGLNPGNDITSSIAAVLSNTDIGHAEYLLDELYDQSLILEPERGRYRYHDLLKDFAKEKADDEESESSKSKAVFDIIQFYLHSVKAADNVLRPHGRPIEIPESVTAAPVVELKSHDQALKWLERERLNILASFQVAVDLEDDSVVCQIAGLLAHFLLTVGYTSDSFDVHFRARESATRIGSQVFEALALTNIGHTYLESGEFGFALEHFEEGLKVWLSIGDKDGQATALNGIGFTLERVGRYHDALTRLSDALKKRRQIKDKFGEAHVRNAIGAVQWRLHHYRKAMGCFKKALKIREDISDEYGRGHTLNNMGFTFYKLKDFVQAETLLLQALSIGRKIRDRHGEAVTLVNLGYTLEKAGRTIEGLRNASRGLKLAKAIGSLYQEGRALDAKARNYLAQGHTQKACSLWNSALKIFEILEVPESDEVKSFLASSDCS